MEKNKNKYSRYICIVVAFLIVVLSIIAIYIAYIKNSNENRGNSNDSIKFKQEYESLNTLKKDDGANKYVNVEIPEDNTIVYADINKVFDILESKTGIIYFGKPTCPWCRNMLPVLIEAAKSNNLNIYYYNPQEIRENNTIEYQNLVEKLYDFLPVDTTTQKETDSSFDKNKKRLYMPDVYFVKNGKIVGNHMSTVESQTDPKIALNEQQKEELKKIYTDLIKKMQTDTDNTCNDSKNELC